jgi:hypothetical protein
MNTDLMKPEPMTKDQLEYIKKEIKKTYLYLISHTGFDPEVIEIMKLAALADVQKRFEAVESWKLGQAAFNNLGISSQVRPFNNLPDFFLFTPPHCLKKNGTLALKHWSRISVTHCDSMGRALGPDSPPTITQSIPLKFNSGKGPSKGSNDKNLITAPVCLR